MVERASRGALSSVVAALFPVACPGCGASGAPVCAACAARARRAEPSPTPPGLDDWWSPFAYEGVVREVIARVKYRDARASVSWLADAIVLARPVAAYDLVTWAPTTRRRRRARGFDHAALLASAVARRWNLPRRALLIRLDDRAQTGRAAIDRRRAPPRFECNSPQARGQRILLIDDVATTGATLTAAAASLRCAGAAEVVAATVARALPRAASEASEESRAARSIPPGSNLYGPTR